MRKRGRPPAIDNEMADKIRQLRAQGLSARKISATVNICKSAVGRFLKGEQENVGVR